jgi:hypothetical protein
MDPDFDDKVKLSMIRSECKRIYKDYPELLQAALAWLDAMMK